MNFRDVTGRNNEASDLQVSLCEVDEVTAKTHLAEIEDRDPVAWNLMFNNKVRTSAWTAAALTDFRDLYNKISTGTLRWVLSTGLPLHTDFSISLNGEPVESSKEQLRVLQKIDFDERLSGIGQIKGVARIHKKELTHGQLLL